MMKVEKFYEVLKLVSEGQSVLKAVKGIMSVNTFYEGIKTHNLGDDYTRARELRSDRIFEDILTIADQAANDTYIDAEGKERVSREVLERAKIQIDARKWMLGKMMPKKYGDKLDVTSDGNAMPAPVIIVQKPDAD
jgi:hypothetical protein